MNVNQHVRMCFGMTLFNRADYIPEALESLLNQSCRDFKIIAIDDCSSDATEEVMRTFIKRDDRISYFRNSTHEGMISTWRKAFFMALEKYRPEFFAWASDHDRWDSRWLESHIAALDAHPDCVLAYSSAAAIDASGKLLDVEIPDYIDTHGLGFVDHLVQVVLNLRGAGYAVYGLFRADSLLKAGVFRHVVLPDRLLLTELAAYGKFVHIPELLWYRRHFEPTLQLSDTINRQRERLFGPHNTPIHTQTPFLSHFVSLLVNLVLDQTSRKSIFISRGLILAGLVWEKRRKHIIKEIDHLVSETPSSPLFDLSAMMNFQRDNWLAVMVLALQLIRERNLKDFSPFYHIAMRIISFKESNQTIIDACDTESETSQNKVDDKQRSMMQEIGSSDRSHVFEDSKIKPGLCSQVMWELLKDASMRVARENVLQNDLRLKLFRSKQKAENLREKLVDCKNKLAEITEEKRLLEAEKKFWEEKARLGTMHKLHKIIEIILTKNLRKK